MKMVVLDFGGGTFDVSVLGYNHGQFAVKAVGGDLHLGEPSCWIIHTSITSSSGRA